MVKEKLLLYILLYFNILFCFSQNNFNILNHQNKESLRFKYINNLIILSVNINGENLNFILDTGVRQSILFNVTTSNSLDLNQIKKISIRGLGDGEKFEALESKNNLLRIKNIVCADFKLLIILDKKFDFSARMGMDVHGIIGSELFKDFVIEVNYNRKKITFNKPETYLYKKCRKCETFPLKFHFQKPYINGVISTFDNKQFPVKLLIDSGGSDSLWLFEKSFSNYTIPPKNFDDMLGRGLSGNIYGKKSRLKSFSIGSFTFNKLIVSHLDSSSAIGNNVRFKRNGLIGAEILKRFHIIYDYPHGKITLKKNKRHFKNTFKYNKTGIELIHYGKVLVKEQKSKVTFEGNSYENKHLNEMLSTYSYSFKNAYQISFIKPNSIADKVGLQKNDIISKINGNSAYQYSLQQIINKLSDKAGKTIKIQVNRNNVFYDYKLELKELL